MALQKSENKSLALTKTTDHQQISSRAKKTILDEDDYVENVEKIIVRDFYPDLPKLHAQAEYLDALKRNDVQKLREIHIKYGPKRGSKSTPTIYSTPASFETPEVSAKETPRDAAGAKTTTQPAEASSEEQSQDENPTHNPEPQVKKAKDPSALTLDRFLARNTSEDNAAFEEIMSESDRKHRAKHAWLYDKALELEADKQGQLALPGIEQQAIQAGSMKVETWTYRPKNSVMYVPEGLEKTTAEREATQGHSREIIHNNTRFAAVPFNPDKNKEQLSEAASTQAQRLHGKIGPDGKEILPAETPKVGGYGFVATPSPAPGVEDSPLMTWGEIEGTPFRLDGSDTPLVRSGGAGPTFKIPDVPRRDKLGMALAEKVSKSHRMKKEQALKRVTANFSSPSHKFGSASKTERLMNLSPAAQKLASAKLGVRTNTDKALRASYTPSPSHRLTPRDKTPNSTPGSGRKTPRGTPGRQTPGRQTPTTAAKRTPSQTSLTDNLLNLPKRSRASDYFDDGNNS